MPLLSALSAYLLKSLRRDNGRAAKITLLGPGRAGFLNPYPRPHPILLQLRPCWTPRFPSSGRLLPACAACTCAWRAPHPPPGLEPPPSVAPDSGGPCNAATTVGVAEEMPGLVLLECWELCVGGSLRVRPKRSLPTMPWDARKLRLRSSVACSSERPSVGLFLPSAHF